MPRRNIFLLFYVVGLLIVDLWLFSYDGKVFFVLENIRAKLLIALLANLVAAIVAILIYQYLSAPSPIRSTLSCMRLCKAGILFGLVTPYSAFALSFFLVKGETTRLEVSFGDASLAAVGSLLISALFRGYLNNHYTKLCSPSNRRWAAQVPL